MSGAAARRDAGLPDPEQNEPLDDAAYRHQWALLKSLHCARPVLHEGLSRFINCLSANLSGSQVDMTVYLAGVKGGIDSKEIQIKTTQNEGTKDEHGNE